jgi:hypothetical protein
MNYSLGKKSLKNIDSIVVSGKKASRILAAAVCDFINDTPIDYGVIDNGGFRTTEDQQLLFKKKRSKCDGINKKSYHQSGLAIDLVPWVNKKYTWDRDHCLVLAGAFLSYCNRMEIPVTSGVDWNGDGNIKNDSWDPCHFQIKDI